MRIVAQYSHLNGKEYLLVHKPDLWQEVKSVIENVDAYEHRTMVSKERNKQGVALGIITLSKVRIIII